MLLNRMCCCVVIGLLAPECWASLPLALLPLWSLLWSLLVLRLSLSLVVVVVALFVYYYYYYELVLSPYRNVSHVGPRCPSPCCPTNRLFTNCWSFMGIILLKLLPIRPQPEKVNVPMNVACHPKPYHSISGIHTYIHTCIYIYIYIYIYTYIHTYT